MPRSLRQVRRLRAWGSLNDGTSPVAIGDDELLVARNVEDNRRGALSKRPGRSIYAEVADFPEERVYNLALTNDGAASSDFLDGTVYARVTYSTVAGETDDLHAAYAAVDVSAGDAVKAWIPFHLINKTVLEHDVGALTFKFNAQLLTDTFSGMATDAFKGFYVFCRDPRLQDETQLGGNPEYRKLWDRKNFIAKITGFIPSTGQFTIDRALNTSLAGLRVDIMMPDRNGLPIRAANVYVTQDGSSNIDYTFHLGGQTVDGDYVPAIIQPGGTNTFVITNANGTSAPSKRLSSYRDPPTAAAADLTFTNPMTGVVEPWPTGMEAGVYVLRQAYRTANHTLLEGDPDNTWPGYPGFGLKKRQFLEEQWTWPSRAALVPIQHDQGISGNMPALSSNFDPFSYPLPNGATAARLFARQLDITSNYSFDGTITFFAPSTRNSAFYASNADASVIALDPSSFESDPSATELADYRPLYWNRHSGQTGQNVTADATSAETSYGKLQCGLKLSAGDAANANYIKVFASVRYFWEDGEVADTARTMNVRYWDGSSWVTVKTVTPVSGFFDAVTVQPDTVAGEYWLRNWTFLIPWDPAMAVGDKLFVDFKVNAGAKVSVNTVRCGSIYTWDPLVEDGSVQSNEFQVWEYPRYPVDAASAFDASLAIPSLTTVTFVVKAPVPLYNGTPCRRNTTSAWPVQLYADPVADTEGQNPEDFTQIVGCADSVFAEESNTLFRVYQEDTPDGRNCATTMDVTQFDWRFTSALNRVFFCNPAKHDYNLRFDGVATFPMGLGSASGSAVVPDPLVPPEEAPVPDAPSPCSQFTVRENWHYDENNVPTNHVDPAQVARWEVTDPVGGIHWVWDWRFYDYHHHQLALQFVQASHHIPLGSPLVFVSGSNGIGIRNDGVYDDDIIQCLTSGQLTSNVATQPVVSVGAPDSAGQTTTNVGGVNPGDFDWYVQHERALDVPGRSYLAASAPALITTLTITEDSSVTLTIPPPGDPQVTHAGIYRNITGTATYFLVTRIPIGNPDENGNYTIIDSTPDESLQAIGTTLNFETGRPPAATLLLYHAGRTWFVQQTNRELVSFSNLINQSGGSDPEGFYPTSTIEIPMPKMAAITCLWPLESAVLAHSDSGIVALSLLSGSVEGVGGISAQALFSDVGALGPHACCSVGALVFMMTRKGPHVIVGREVENISAKIEGTVRKINYSSEATQFYRVVRYANAGKDQVLFTYSQLGRTEANEMLMFNLRVGGDGEPQRLWRKWTEMYAHSAVQSKDGRGVEMILFGDSWGRLWRHDSSTSDAGVFIDAEAMGKAAGLGDNASSDQLRWIYLFANGGAKDFLAVDINKDQRRVAVNPRRILVNPSNNDDTRWGDRIPIATWNYPNATNLAWSNEPTSFYSEHRLALSKVFRQVQVAISQKWVDMPPGVRLGAEIDTTGYDIIYYESGARPAGQRAIAPVTNNPVDAS